MKKNISSLSRFVISLLCNCFIFFASCLNAEGQIRVELPTRSKVVATYVCRIQSEDEALSASYLEQLQKILRFDLAYSGFTSVGAVDPALEKIALHTDPALCFDSDKWSRAQVSFVIKAIAKNKQLEFFIFSLKSGAVKRLQGITLSGNLSQDRLQVHKLSDAIIKNFFNGEGAAYSHILYCVQKKKQGSQSPFLALPLNATWESEIWQCDWDGGNSHPITEEKSYCITPVLFPSQTSHNKDQYLYVTYKNGQPKIYLSTLKNKTGAPLISLRGNQLLPAISKQRDKIAFISDAAGRADLFIQKIKPDGSLSDKPIQLFSFPNATQASPTFSPDGTQIAFVSDKDGTPRIYLLGYSSTAPLLLTKLNKENTCPAWSPDGKKLAYSAKVGGVRQIWIYDFETKEERQLTSGPGSKENPSWAPNSVHLVFNSTDPDSSELYVVNLNQPDAVQITQGTGKKHYPTWGDR